MIELTDRLGHLADRYRTEFGVDVDAIPGAGAAGGLAGGLAALGARIAPGFDLVADLIGLPERIAARRPGGHRRGPPRSALLPRQGARRRAGPGAGALPGAVHRRRRRRRQLLADPPDGIDIVSLSQRFGADRARARDRGPDGQVTAEKLAAWSP